MTNLSIIAAQFVPGSTVCDVQEYGSGNVNDTFLVTSDANQDSSFILQRINTHVFKQPKYIMMNMRTFSEHVQERLNKEPPQERRWQVPRVLSTETGQDFYIDDQGAFWRAISFIRGARTSDQVENVDHAREAGYALGRFQSLISDLSIDQLYDTLIGFHVTPQYLAQYQKALKDRPPAQNNAAVRHCLNFVQSRQNWAFVLEDAKTQGQLVTRPIHGDPKINNIMIDKVTGQAVGIVDLDTVKPGLVHYDIGDCLRSCCNPLGEETDDIEHVRFETDLCKAILEGYIPVANSFLTANDFDLIYESIRLIAFELGLRFFTDYINGNLYFKANSPDHNLQRAMVQFKVMESIEAQKKQIKAIITDLQTR